MAMIVASSCASASRSGSTLHSSLARTRGGICLPSLSRLISQSGCGEEPTSAVGRSLVMAQSFALRAISIELHVQKPRRVASKHLMPGGRIKPQLIERLEGRADRPERGIGREHDAIGAEEFEAAAQRVGAPAEHRGISIEVVEV